MAASKRIIVATLGSQTIRLAEFQRSADGGLILAGLVSQDLAADVSSEAMRNTQIRLALEQLRGQLGIRKRADLACALSGQSVFARFVKLPAVSPDQVEQVVGFEAQQNVPFPINEVVWDYQLLGKSGGEEVEVVLVAIKSETLDALNDSLSESGFHASLVDVAPMALYNAFRYSYSDVAGCSLLVDIGAKTTNLLFVEPGRIFSRSIPIGGATITTAIAKEFNSPFAVAEERKRRDGFVSLGGAYAAPSDPDIALVSKVIRNTMTRLHAEIGRSISFYRAQQQGNPPKQIFLCGGSCALPYLKEFFLEKLQVPIEYLNPLRNVAVSANLKIENVARESHVVGELVGLALRRVSACPMELNLRPAKVTRAEREARQRPALVVAAICLIAALAGYGVYLQRAATLKAEVLEEMQGEVVERQKFERGIKEVEKKAQAATQTMQPLLTAVANRQYWAEIINDLSTHLPQEFIWVTSLQPTSNGQILSFGPVDGPAATRVRQPARDGEGASPFIDGVRIRGLFIDGPRRASVIQDYVANLARSNVFEIDASKPAEIILTSATPNDSAWAFDYELQLNLRRPIALQ